jgi:hypothetical protein
MARKSRGSRPTMVRLPEGLRRQLEQLAKFYGRSLSAEIIYRLEQSIAERTKGGQSADEQIRDELQQVRDELRLIRGELHDLRLDFLSAPPKDEPK